MFDRAIPNAVRRWRTLIASGALCVALAACSDGEAPNAGGAADQADGAGACGRDCLIGLLDQLMAAAVAGDPEAAPLADDFHATQNAVETAPGEGVWQTLTGLGSLQRRYADPETGQAAYMGLAGAGRQPVIVSLRIKAEDRRITEAEWVVSRENTAMFNPAGFTANPPPPDTGGSGTTREAAIAAVESYYDGIEAASPDGVLVQPGCYRIENGTWMVGRMPGRDPVDPAEAQPGLTTALNPVQESYCLTGFENLDDVTEAVLERRYFYDDQAGVVWSAGVFERVEGAVGRDGQPVPWMYFNSLYPIRDGRLEGVYAATVYLPPDVVSSGWPADGAATAP